MGILLKEGHGPLTDKGIWKYVLTNEAVFLNKDLGGSFLQMNQIPTNYFWKITFLCSFFFGSQAMLSCAVLCCQDRFLPAQDHTAGTVPAAADPCCRTAFGKGPKLSLYFTDFTQAIQTLKHNLASFLLRRR